jgi:hypothetical protein
MEKCVCLINAIMRVIGQEVEIDGVVGMKIGADFAPIIEAQIVCLAATMSGHPGMVDPSLRRDLFLSVVEALQDNIEQFFDNPECRHIPIQ